MNKNSKITFAIALFFSQSSLICAMETGSPKVIPLIVKSDSKTRVLVQKSMQLMTPAYDKTISLSDLAYTAPHQIKKSLYKKSLNYRWYPQQGQGCFPFDTQQYTSLDQICAQFTHTNTPHEWRKGSLLVAAQANNAPWVLFLLQHGANAQEPHETPPLQYTRSSLIARLLCDHGARIEQLPNNHMSSIILNSEPKLIQFFAHNGLNVNTPDHNGRTPLEKVTSIKRLDNLSSTAAQHLLHAGADIFNTTNNFQNTQKLLHQRALQLTHMPEEQQQIKVLEKILIKEQINRQKKIYKLLYLLNFPVDVSTIVYHYYASPLKKLYP